MNLASNISKVSDKDKRLPDIDIDFNMDVESFVFELLSRFNNVELIAEEVTYPPSAGVTMELTERFVARSIPILPASSEFRGFQPGVLYDFRNGVIRP